MKLHSPSFQKGLRRAVKRELQRSPDLKKEVRVLRNFRRYGTMWLLRPAVSAVVVFSVWRIAEFTRHPATALAFLSLWALLFVFIHAQGLLSGLYEAGDLPALWLLPVSEQTAFHWELQKFFRGTLMSLVDLLLGFMALAWWLDIPMLKWPAVLSIAVLTWLTVLALALLGAAHAPRIPYQLITMVLIASAFIIFMARSVIGSALVRVLDNCASGLNLLLPSGWPVSLFQLLLPGGNWTMLFLLFPIGAILWSVKASVARLQSGLQFEEPTFPEAPDLLPEDGEEGDPVFESALEEPPRVGSTEIKAMVQSRQFLACPGWGRNGWFEHWLWRWLKPREKILTEFVFPAGVSISRPWKKILRNLAIALVAGMAAEFISPSFKTWTLAAGLFVTFCQTMAVMLTTGRAFEPIHCSGVAIPRYAGYAIGYRELTHVLLKFSVVQLPFFIPYAIFCGSLVAFLIHYPIIAGALFGFKIGFLMFASRFILAALAFSGGTNDNSGFCWRPVVLLLMIVFGGLLFAALGAASLFVPPPTIAWLLWALAGVTSYCFFAVYGWFYNGNRFDLMRVPEQE